MYTNSVNILEFSLNKSSLFFNKQFRTKCHISSAYFLSSQLTEQAQMKLKKSFPMNILNALAFLEGILLDKYRYSFTFDLFIYRLETPTTFQLLL